MQFSAIHLLKDGVFLFVPLEPALKDIYTVTVHGSSENVPADDNCRRLKLYNISLWAFNSNLYRFATRSPLFFQYLTVSPAVGILDVV